MHYMKSTGPCVIEFNQIVWLFSKFTFSENCGSPCLIEFNQNFVGSLTESTVLFYKIEKYFLLQNINYAKSAKKSIEFNQIFWVMSKVVLWNTSWKVKILALFWLNLIKTSGCEKLHNFYFLSLPSLKIVAAVVWLNSIKILQDLTECTVLFFKSEKFFLLQNINSAKSARKSIEFNQIFGVMSRVMFFETHCER